MSQWKSGYTVVAICVAVVFISLIAAVTVTVVIGGTDPDVFLRFLAGPAITSIISTVAVAYITVVNRKVGKVTDTVSQIEKNTNGNTTALLAQINRLTNHLAAADAVPVDQTDAKIIGKETQ